MSDNRFRCPKCGSENIQSYEVIYTGGRSSHVSTTESVSAGTDFNIGHATTSGNSVSHLAQTCAPPVKQESHGCGCLLMIIVLAFVAAIIHPVAAAVVLIALFMLYRSMNKDVEEYNTKKYPGLYNQWLNSYYCHRCGHRFVMH